MRLMWKRSGSEDDSVKRVWRLLKGFSVKDMKKDQLLILLLSGILLLVISIPVGKGDESGGGREGGKETGAKGTVRADQNGYVRELEERLAAALSQMSGVGDVTVMITLKSSAEKVIEKDVETADEEVTESDSQGGTRTTRNGNRAETTIYSGGDSSGEPYISKELSPRIEGVLVIAEGGGDSLVKQNITEVIQALFGIDTHKIRIMKKSSK